MSEALTTSAPTACGVFLRLKRRHAGAFGRVGHLFSAACGAFGRSSTSPGRSSARSSRDLGIYSNREELAKQGLMAVWVLRLKDRWRASSLHLLREKRETTLYTKTRADSDHRRLFERGGEPPAASAGTFFPTIPALCSALPRIHLGATERTEAQTQAPSALPRLRPPWRLSAGGYQLGAISWGLSAGGSGWGGIGGGMAALTAAGANACVDRVGLLPWVCQRLICVIGWGTTIRGDSGHFDAKGAHCTAIRGD